MTDANPFDQFDAPAQHAPNPFDQFDPKPGFIASQAKAFGNVYHGAIEGAQPAWRQFTQDLKTPIDTKRYVPHNEGLRGELEAPFAPEIGEAAGVLARGLKIGLDVGGMAGGAVEGATAPAIVPLAAKLGEKSGLPPDEALERAQTLNQGLSNIPFAIEGAVRGPHVPDVVPEKFAPVQPKSVYTSPVPSNPVLSGETADAFVSSSPIGTVLDAFGEGPKTNWGIKDLAADLDIKSLPKDTITPLVQTYAEATKAFNESFQRSAAASGLVQAGPSITEQLAAARNFGIIGEGEGGWSGLVEPNEAHVLARNEAAKSLPPEVPAFDIHAAARQIAPEVFEGPHGYDALDEQRQTLRNSLVQLTEARSAEATGDIDAKLAEFPGDHPERMFDKAADLHDEREAILQRIRTQGDTPEIAQVRQAIQETDYKMRDMAEQVSAAYRAARERGPVEAPVEPQEAPKAAPAPVEQPQATPQAAPQEVTARAIEAVKASEAAPSRPVPANVASDVSAKLIAAGRPAEEADAAGQLIAAHYDARAARFGGALGTGPELYAREAPEIRGGRVRAAVPEREYAQTSRGKIAFRDAQSTITLMKDANASTFIHETGHQWLEEMMRDAKDERAPADLTRDTKTVRDYLGAKDGEEISTRQHEKFARSFERYMMEGTAPSKGLADVFAKFKDWLTQIYQTVTKLRAPINDDIRAVFDRLLTKPGEEAVIAPERAASATFADMHEDDALHTAPEHADPVRDTIRQEVVQLAERGTPDIVPDLTNGGEAGGGPAPADGDTGGNSPTEPRPGPAGNAEKPPEVAGGGGGSGTEGAPARTGAGAAKSEPPAGANARFTDVESPLVDKAGNIRLDNMNAPDDAKAALREIADSNDNFLSERGGVISDASVQQMAEASGLTFGDIDAFAKTMRMGPVVIRATEKMFIQASQDAQVAAKAFRDAPNEASEMAAIKAWGRMEMLQGTFSRLTSDPGRMLRALSKSDEWRKAGIDPQAAVSEFTGRTPEQWRELFQRAANLETPAQLAKLAHDTNRKGVFDWLQSMYVNALISGPFTHAGYTAAGQAFALFRGVGETSAAAAIGKLRELAGIGEADRAYLSEVPHQLYGQFSGARAGIKAAWQAIKANRTILPPEVEARTGSARGQAINSVGAIPNPVIAGQRIPVGTVIESPGRLVAALHSFNWTTFYSQSIAGQAFRQAMSEGLNGDAFAHRIARLTQSPTDAMIEQASTDASGGALMTQPAYDSFMGNISRLTNWGVKVPDIALRGGKSIPMGTLRPLKYIDPFVQIQANIQKTAFGRGALGVPQLALGTVTGDPLRFFTQATRDDLSMKNGGAAFDRAAGRILAGTGFMVAAGALASEGLLNSSGPSGPAQAREWQRIHGMPHGLTIGNGSYDMLRMGNLGLQMSVAADLYQFGEHIGDEDKMKVASQLVHAFAQNILDESSMRGPAELMKAIDENDRYGDAWIRNFASSAIPFSVGLSQIARQIDPYSREARTTMDAIKAKIPFLSDELQPRYDVWGQPTANRGWAVTPNQQILHDPIDEKLYAIGYYPSLPTRKIRGVQLTDQQYADYARIGGRLAHAMLSTAIMSPGFDSMPPVAKLKIVTSVIDGAREQARNQIMMQSVGTQDDIVAKALAAKKASLH